MKDNGGNLDALDPSGATYVNVRGAASVRPNDLITLGYGNANYAPGANAVTTTTADFVQPAVGGTVLAAVADNRFVALDQTLYVGGPTLGGTAGSYYTAGTLTGTTGVWLTNTGYIGNASAGSYDPPSIDRFTWRC